MEGGRSKLWLVLLVPAIVSASTANGEPATGYVQPATPTGPDTNVLCVSKCGTCPTVCTSPPPPPSPSDAGNNVNNTPKSGGGGGGYSSSPPSTPGSGQSKGGRPSSYYYLFTAAGSRSSGAGASAYAAVFLVFLSVVANLQ